jgi:hypothetical protein
MVAVRLQAIADGYFDDTGKALALRMGTRDRGQQSEVNVAMPHLRGKWSPTKAILRTFVVVFMNAFLC